jgi:hypothetical protein
LCVGVKARKIPFYEQLYEQPGGNMNALDPIDELVARSKDHRELRRFHGFHTAHPEVLDFLVAEIRLRIESGFPAFSFHSLWEYARWQLEMVKGPGATFRLNDHSVPYYARAITIIFPEFNGRAEFRHSTADDVFGTRLEPLSHRRVKNYSRRLEWADGTPIELGWRPRALHAPTRPAKRRHTIHRP